ncbi:MAG: hypothetical protein LBS31_10945 [Candidatus Adiutrix sp.]|jgi:ERCC4-type nuclease|nr:hypothetical protein [Candidatus Adiutrix sp.]
MMIVIDSREQNPFTFAEREDVETIVGTLQTGDYSLQGLEDRIALERKSLNDLTSCLIGANRERFERELCRGRGLEFFAVVVEASFGELASKQYWGGLNPHAAAQSVIAFQIRHQVNFIWAGSRRSAEYFVYWTLSKFLREAETRYKTILKAHGKLQEAALSAA